MIGKRYALIARRTTSFSLFRVRAMVNAGIRPACVINHVLRPACITLYSSGTFASGHERHFSQYPCFLSLDAGPFAVSCPNHKTIYLKKYNFKKEIMISFFIRFIYFPGYPLRHTPVIFEH
ncbi:hypothetical protein PO883_00480 [Massilia sp. DJPM01]|uniref:hypothetical protein n=1 Tax=Massilia sp. DJPM01 TaxID=3024404 RepID=UPI00259F8B34|nr:hypothetical protein [Massilia sp. DJPM01]MDM5175687.1 hypothetical protein [Massilia sp. DJPM01]